MVFGVVSDVAGDQRPSAENNPDPLESTWNDDKQTLGRTFYRLNRSADGSV